MTESLQIESRPALSTLTRRQQDILDEFLQGFGSRSELLRWGQRATIATLGQLDQDWISDLATSRSDLAMLTVRGERERWSTSPPSTPAANEYRRELVAGDLLPACRQAVREIRWSAAEYVDDEDERVDVDEQTHPAMRPALTELDDLQQQSIERLLEGFADHDALLSWLMTTIQASYGEIDEGLSTDLYYESHTRSALLGKGFEEHQERFFRETVAANWLLPAFTTATREVAERAGEKIEREQTDQSPMQYE